VVVYGLFGINCEIYSEVMTSIGIGGISIEFLCFSTIEVTVVGDLTSDILDTL
jgi:hypothetical protein